MIIEISEETAYESMFQHVQFEITGMCNMKCGHCRAWREPRRELSLETIKSVLQFGFNSATQPFFVTISGGEPFKHSDLPAVVKLVSGFPATEVIITTNGWYGNRDNLSAIRQAYGGSLTLQVSLDSISASEHDQFRGTEGAFRKAVETLRLAKELGFLTSVRMSVRPGGLGQMGEYVSMVQGLGVSRVGFGPIIPTGRAKEKSYLMSPAEKKSFHLEIARLRQEYSGRVEVTTEDPLKAALKMPEVWDNGDINPDEEGVFGGCTAGISSFNVGSGGVITPCAVLPIDITSVVGKTPEQIERDYCSSPAVKSLFLRTFSGKCGSCSLRRVCGGCRAVPFGLSGGFLGSDETCWFCEQG